MSLRRLILTICLILFAAISALAVWFLRDNRSAHARIATGSTVIDSPYGAIEFARGGSGLETVLVVHGSGGGFDQGALIADAVLDGSAAWIAPSRFGYLRSAFPAGATFEDQARAYAHLLDALGIRRVAVLALSHGGPSALHFAALYPERVSSLTLLSCGVASASGGAQAGANVKGDQLAAIFKYDILYWAVSTFGRRPLMRLMGANDAVIAGLTTGQRALVDRVIDSMMPVSVRYPGVAMDNTAAMPNERVAGIRAPTLVLHATDDALQLYRNAEYATARIPGARLVPFSRGGHLLIAVEQEAVRREVGAFIRETRQRN